MGGGLGVGHDWSRLVSVSVGIQNAMSRGNCDGVWLFTLVIPKLVLTWLARGDAIAKQ